jgi:ribosomal protein S18 acetylase RimI-like enzyme
VIVRATLAEPQLLDQAVRTFRGHGDVERFLAAEGTVAFLAVEKTTIQGWCWGYHLIRPDAASMAYLHELEVVEDWRRRGLGRQLLGAFMATASFLGARRMFLNTGVDNVPARKLYESLGGRHAEQGGTVSYWFHL